MLAEEYIFQVLLKTVDVRSGSSRCYSTLNSREMLSFVHIKWLSEKNSYIHLLEFLQEYTEQGTSIKAYVPAIAFEAATNTPAGLHMIRTKQKLYEIKN